MATRREFLTTALAGVGAITVLPYAARAARHGADAFATPGGGEVSVHPISHASLVLKTPNGTVYVDPVGDPAAYAEHGTPDLVMLTHQHGDHFEPSTLSAILGEDTQIVTNPAVYDMLPAEMTDRAMAISNGVTGERNGISIEAVAAYNITEGRLDFHPKGRDNGYVLGIDGLRVYISGDTEGTDEMRALDGIDVAFVCMNLPFTMSAAQAAAAVAEFKPKVVYPYHYRGRDNGTQDPKEFAVMLEAAGGGADVKYGEWYPGGL